MVPFPVEALLKALFEYPHRHTGRLIQVIRNPFMSTTPTNHHTTLHNRATWRAQSPWVSALPSLWKSSSLCLVLFWHPVTWTTASNASASPASILGMPQTPNSSTCLLLVPGNLIWLLPLFLNSYPCPFIGQPQQWVTSSSVGLNKGLLTALFALSTELWCLSIWLYLRDLCAFILQPSA